MSADKPTNAGGERKAEARPETRSDELAAAHAYLDQLMVYRPGAGDPRLTVEERLRALFGDRPQGADGGASPEARLEALETQLLRLWNYIQETQRFGSARLGAVEMDIVAAESRINTLYRLSGLPPPYGAPGAATSPFVRAGRPW